MRIHRDSHERAGHLRCSCGSALARHLPPPTYRLRNAVESLWSAHERCFGDLAPGRTAATRFRDVLHHCALLWP